MNIKTITILLILLTITQSSYSQLNNWEYCGIDSVSITAMHSFGNGHLIAGSNNEAQPVYVSHNYGKTWDTLSMALPSDEIRRFEYFNNTLFACLIGNYPSIYMSNDTGKTWYTPDTINGQYKYPLYYTYCMEAKDSVVIAGGFNKYARSTDYGDTWEKLYLCDFFDDLDENEVGAMLSMVQFRDTLYVGTQCGVFATKDWGLSWEKRGKNSSGAGSAEVGSIDFLDSTLMIGTRNGIYFSYSFGGIGLTDWKWIFHNESGISELYNVDDSLLMFYNSHGSYLDLFWSNDTGETWGKFFLEDSINNIDVNSFCHDDKYLYIGSYYGVWRCPRFDNVTIKKNYESYKFENSFIKLNKNKLNIFVTSESYISAFIYSLSGRKIVTLFENKKQKGKYCYNLSCYNRDISTGMYLINVTINGHNITKKISIIN